VGGAFTIAGRAALEILIAAAPRERLRSGRQQKLEQEVKYNGIDRTQRRRSSVGRQCSAVQMQQRSQQEAFAGWWGGGGLGRRWLGCVFDASAEQSTSQMIGEGGRGPSVTHGRTAADRPDGGKAGNSRRQATSERCAVLGSAAYGGEEQTEAL
jgi:hypothetical protein